MADPQTNGHTEVVEKAVPGGLMVEVGRTGLSQMSGYIYEEFARDLRGSRAIKTYREMRDNDSVIGALFFAIEMLMRQVDWRVEPAEEDTAGEWSDFVEGAMHDLSITWEDTLSNILSFLQFGWELSEICYKTRDGYKPEASEKPSSSFDDGKIGWRKFAPRAQETLWRWEFDDTGGVQGMWQIIPGQGPVLIPIEKALLFRTSTRKGSPEGMSILRSAYVSWFYKKHIAEIEAIGIERDLAGLPVMESPIRIFRQDASPADKQTKAAIDQMVRNVKRNDQDGVHMPQEYDDKGNKMYDLHLLTSGGRRQVDTDAIITRYDQRIAMSVLADFILIGHERMGSYALSVSKIEVFATALSAWLDSIMEVFNAHAIPRLLALNGVDPMLAPKMTHAEVQRTDLDQIGTYMKNLAASGMPLFPDTELESYLRGAADLPEQAATSEQM